VGLSVLAAIRPDSWNFPLLVHAFGAMVLVGGLVTCTASLAFARGEPRLLRLGYWSLLAISLPGWILMRIGAQWIYSKEHWDDLPDRLIPRWLNIGFIVADLSGLILLVSLIVGGIGVYRMRQGKGTGLLRVTLILAIVLLAAAVVAVWAMAGKPH
jgi:ABC-type maltose transport system permease subunit